eukprot:CAMPEP_0119541236 /NCGR_PEP_ID=MMETSP1344-20130328/52833_1 /TAXON_ID=236787 /ORGANISM="Florenciella parvula, Strain CCMP2471" /LENGTH=535 /DNA_ID=CAMNT_0007585181 /DNA_START=198 /DNA_END=1803 /DNA_ORIENTATION=-
MCADAALSRSSVYAGLSRQVSLVSPHLASPRATSPLFTRLFLGELVGVAQALLLLQEHLVVLVDDGHRQKNARTRTDRTEEVGHDGERADAHAAEGRGGGDVPVEHGDHGHVAVALHDHLLVAQLLGHVARRRARDLDPGLGEERARGEHEDNVDDRVDRVTDDLAEGVWRRDVVRQTVHRGRLPALVLPHTEEAHEDVVRRAVVEELREEVEVRHERGLEDDRHVRGVEELDRVARLLAAVLHVLDLEVDAPALEVDYDHEDQDGRQKVRDVRQVRPVERLLERADLVRAGDDEVEERDDGALELGALTRVDGGRGEGLPDDVLARVGRDEERDARAQTVALLHELVEGDDHDASEEELEHDQDGVTRAEGAERAVGAREHVGHGLAEGDDDAEELLGALEQRTVLLEALVDLDDVRARKQLHDEARGDDRRDAELHQRAAVRREEHADPVERVRRLRGLDAVERNLAAHEEDEQHDDRPEDALAERDLPVGLLHLREDAEHRAYEMKEPHGGGAVVYDRVVCAVHWSWLSLRL